MLKEEKISFMVNMNITITMKKYLSLFLFFKILKAIFSLQLLKNNMFKVFLLLLFYVLMEQVQFIPVLTYIACANALLHSLSVNYQRMNYCIGPLLLKVVIIIIVKMIRMQYLALK